ncbi:hypothetical protein [Moorena sp. SIO3H5]|uniref:hypothetical protein n=1 Tax=Moorena sp. SIO3H5 TaxID=2607834 RepID=UPI0025D1F193|nr:hypothetical protein [Moorena sp. SIO3H5]
MQRGLGGNPHERLHQDTGILRRTGILPVSAVVSPMSDCRGFPHSRFASRHWHLGRTGILVELASW